MATIVNKSIPAQGPIKSENKASYSEDDYWINPVLPSCDCRYWKNDNGVLCEMSELEKQAVDNIVIDLLPWESE